MKTITFIGNGNMAFSIAEGLKERYTLEVVGRDLQNLIKFEDKLGIKIKKSLLENFDMSDRTVILCIKPSNIEEVSHKLNGEAKIIYSVLAGTPIEKIRELLQPNAIVRTMPNLAASVKKSMTTLCGDEDFRDEAIEIFGAIGATLWVGSQKELDIATALAGSGPAYLALIAEALADGAVKQGMKRDDAMSVMRGLFGGFGALIQDIHPALLKDGVMSAGGTTAAGYSALEDKGVRSAFIDAVERAYKRAKEL